MMHLMKLNIPEGPERDAFIRRLAEAKSPEERQRIATEVEKFHSEECPSILQRGEDDR